MESRALTIFGFKVVMLVLKKYIVLFFFFIYDNVRREKWFHNAGVGGANLIFILLCFTFFVCFRIGYGFFRRFDQAIFTQANSAITRTMGIGNRFRKWFFRLFRSVVF